MSYKILITEDDEITANFLFISLQKIGYTDVLISHTGEDAIQQCENNSPDIVLMDIELSGKIDGIKAMDHIRKAFHIPVIYVTGNTNHETLKRALESNPNGYVLKPINGEQLYPIIEMSMRRHKLELELRNLNEQLEEKVEERTKELTSKNIILEQEILQRQAIEKELKQSLAKEKEINELKSRIVGIVSHEFKTPLTTILSSAQLIDYHLSIQSAQQKIQQHSSTIIKSVKLLTEIINETLFLSKSDADQFSISKSKFAPAQLIPKIIHDVKIGIGKQHQLIFNHSQENEIELRSDLRLLKQIVTNLLSNAIKYSPYNKTIHINSYYSANGWHLDIQDHGIGIPKNDIKLLFKMFNRASNATNFEGTGLGLAIVKRCLDLIGAKISVESEENNGSTFSIFLPSINLDQKAAVA